jgi:CarboxypepD_reg-like domain
MKTYITFLFVFFFFWQIKSQQINQGILLDSVTKQPIEFANIGLVGKGYGTVSNEKGEYRFSIPDTLLSGTIKVSIIGYKPKTFSAKGFDKRKNILLSQSTIPLNEIKVAAKKLKIKVVGNETRNSINGGFTGNNLGAEMGVKLNIKHANTQIRKFMVNLSRNTLDKTPVFRLNIYNVDAKGYPKENILKENIVIEPKTLVGFIEVDLKPYSILVNEDVIISLEWIKDLGNVSGLYFSSKLVNGSTYFRNASQDKWEKISGVGVGLHAEIGY